MTKGKRVDKVAVTVIKNETIKITSSDPDAVIGGAFTHELEEAIVGDGQTPEGVARGVFGRRCDKGLKCVGQFEYVDPQKCQHGTCYVYTVEPDLWPLGLYMSKAELDKVPYIGKSLSLKKAIDFIF